MHPAYVLTSFSKDSPYALMDSTHEIMMSLRAARALLGITQDELAERTGVGRNILQRIENGTSVPTAQIDLIRSYMEKHGIVFLESSVEHGPAVALRRPTRPRDH